MEEYKARIKEKRERERERERGRAEENWVLTRRKSNEHE